jgi:hypothetical protein
MRKSLIRIWAFGQRLLMQADMAVCIHVHNRQDMIALRDKLARQRRRAADPAKSTGNGLFFQALQRVGELLQALVAVILTFVVVSCPKAADRAERYSASCILPVFTVKQRARPALWSKSTLKDIRSKLSGRRQ